jgi:hypothetical protein
MTPLLQSADCSILLIDPRKKHLDRLDPQSRKQIAQSLELVERAARAIAVPIHLAFPDGAPDPQHWIAGLGTAEPSRAHDLGSNGSSWSHSGLAAALDGQGRASLVLCGFWLETTVTFIALPALASGFDVFILMDAAPALAEHAHRPASNRLLQAGAVPTTTRQLVAEWIEASAVPDQRSTLSLLLATD